MDSGLVTTVPTFSESQEDLDLAISQTSRSSLSPAKPKRQDSPFVPIEVQPLSSESRLGLSRSPLQNRTPRRSRTSTPVKSTPKARLRHDDSQIQFAPIDSSPPGEASGESQLLTDRQREVKERQQTEAAMFPDLRSSPLPRSQVGKAPHSELTLSSSLSRDGNVLSDGPTTPTLPPPAHSPFNEFLLSSPTPRPDNDTSSPLEPRAGREEEQPMEFPSSPPSRLDTDDAEAAHDARPTRPRILAVDGANSVDNESSQQATDVAEKGSLGTSCSDGDRNIGHTCKPEKETTTIASLVDSSSNNNDASESHKATGEIAVNASQPSLYPSDETTTNYGRARQDGPSVNPQLIGSVDEIGTVPSISDDDDVSRVLNSFCIEQEDSIVPTQDTHCATSGLEEAARDASQFSVATSQGSSQKPKKRKRGSVGRGKNGKKAKSTAAESQDDIFDRNTAADDDDMLDCIVVVSRPTEESQSQSQPTLDCKPESTPRKPSQKNAENTPYVSRKGKPGRPKRKIEGSQQADTTPNAEHRRSKKRLASEISTDQGTTETVEAAREIACNASPPATKRRRSPRSTQGSQVGASLLDSDNDQEGSTSGNYDSIMSSFKASSGRKGGRRKASQAGKGSSNESPDVAVAETQASAAVKKNPVEHLDAREESPQEVDGAASTSREDVLNEETGQQKALLAREGDSLQEPTAPEGEETTETGILSALRRILGSLKRAVVGPDALREMDDVLFEVRKEAHQASLRHAE
ncbi:MAG: hypothetical protein M1819_005237 [Sarea resinae]|nr:MAG: hypothetical protein M1819_005237 [Sarea resinae]